MSARIFAAYSLAAEYSTHDSTPQRSTTRSHCSSALAPILPVLSSLVQVEAVSLANSGDVEKKKQKLINFCGFDCSAVQPPVDRVDGSQIHQQESIQALVNAKEQADALVQLVFERQQQQQVNENFEQHKTDTATSRREMSCLQALVEFLNHEEGQQDEKETSWLRECAKAIRADYHPGRVSKAVELYRQDFSIILKRMGGSKSWSCSNNEDNNDDLTHRH